jgi:hypothetical protein
MCDASNIVCGSFAGNGVRGIPSQVSPYGVVATCARTATAWSYVVEAVKVMLAKSGTELGEALWMRERESTVGITEAMGLVAVGFTVAVSVATEEGDAGIPLVAVGDVTGDRLICLGEYVSTRAKTTTRTAAATAALVVMMRVGLIEPLSSRILRRSTACQTS